MKILIIGANGLVGKSLLHCSKRAGLEMIPYARSGLGPGFLYMDILDFEKSRNEIISVKPDAVILCANMAGGVNFCEKEKVKADIFHYEATKNIAQACQEASSSFVFISSDYVFPDGKEPYIESAVPSPLNYYGIVKLRIENWLKENIQHCLIVRTTNVYGWDPLTKTPNYFMNCYQKLLKGEDVIAPNYLFGNPTYSLDLADGIVSLLVKKRFELYHVVGPENMNRFQWASSVKDYFSLSGGVIVDDDSQRMEEVIRPKKIQLNTDKFQDATNIKMKSLRDAFEDIQRMIIC